MTGTTRVPTTTVNDGSGHQDGDDPGSNSGPGDGSSGHGGGNHRFDDPSDD